MDGLGPPPVGSTYGAPAVPAQQAWNPARFAGVGSLTAGVIPADPIGHAQAIMPFLVAVGILYLLAKRHARLRGGVSGSVS